MSRGGSHDLHRDGQQREKGNDCGESGGARTQVVAYEGGGAG